MGTVYLAHDLTLGRSVAIKVLSGEVASDAARIRRFEQEARAASALSHPNVCVVHALGKTPAGEPFIAMEYVEGQTLRHLLHRQPPTLKAALDIAIQIAAGAGAAHAIGIVHRDLKPENVIVREDGLVKVLDFGLAKLAAGGLPADDATRTQVKTDTGVVMGTFTYMAPEQARGQEVDTRTDIWALGVMLYELASGHVPFAGDTRSDVLVSILERDPVPLDRLNPRIPHELQRIVGKALRKDRAQRYQTITDLRLDLEALRTELLAFSQDAPPAAESTLQSVAPPQPVRRESSAEFILMGLSRHKRATAAGLFAVAALAAGITWEARRRTPDGPPPAATHVQRNLTRLTFGGGLQIDPTLAPDGRFLAYASDRAGNLDIWVQPTAGGAPVQVTRESESDSQPAWSPDGSTIVFRSEHAGGGLFVVPALGGPRRQLTSFGERPTWSRDGTEVLFLVGDSVYWSEGPIRLYAVPAEGGAAKELAAAVLRQGVWKWAAEHPDGRISAIGKHATDGPGFYTFSRSGEHLVKSTVSPSTESLIQNFLRFRFIWNRSGTRLYSEAGVNGVFNLWHVDVDPATLAWRSVQQLTTGGGADTSLALSQDETRAAYVQWAASFRLWSFPFDAAGGRLTGEGAAFSEEGAVASHVDLSRDGSAALYSVIRSGMHAAEIWVHRFDTNQQQLLVPDGLNPKWMPGTNSVVYVKRRSPEYSLMLREPNGSERQLSPWNVTPYLVATDFSLDGHSIFVSAHTLDATPLWLWSLTRFSDKPEKVLIDRARAVWQAQISPNGRWLAFVIETDRPRVAVARMEPTPITEWTAVAPTLAHLDKPRWAPDGRTLYFLSRRGGFDNLAGIRFDPDRGVAVGEPFDVTHFTSPGLMITTDKATTEIGIAADRAVLPMMASTASIWMLDNIDR